MQAAPSSSSVRPLSALPGPRGLPLIGNMLQGVAQAHEALERWRDRYGPAYTIRLGREPYLVLSDPASVRRLFRDRPGGFRRIDRLEEILREAGSHGVLSAEGAEWRKQRRLVMPAFGSGPIRAMWEPLRTMSDRLRRRWEQAAAEQRPVEVLVDLARFTVDVTSLLVFGRDLNTLERGSDALQQNLHTVVAMLGRQLLLPVPYWRYVKLPIDRRFERAKAAVKEELHTLIRAAHEAVAAGAPGAAPRTLVEGMIAARDEEDPAVRFTDAEVQGNLLTLVLAGEDTTANTMAWMLYYVAREPAVQARLQAEADRILGPETSLPTPDQVAEMRYAGALARETLRLRSPSPFLGFQALESTILGDVAVPAGTKIWALTRAAELEQVGSSSRTLRPERWLGDERAETRGTLKEPLAFGDGPRICPGRGLALIECALVSAMVGRRFALSLDGEPRERYVFVMAPDGLRIRFRLRDAR